MGRLRIIAGEFRGRKLDVPPGGTVRPTPDRVREALFSILGHDLSACRVADLFAGSGALGFEALSRGAAHTTFVERDGAATAVIRSNAVVLGVETRVRVVAGDVEQVLRTDHALGCFDLVMADPPYATGQAGSLLSWLETARVLAPGARIVFQRDSRSPVVDGTNGLIHRHRTAVYGRTSLDFYHFSDEV